jgi:chain length determinant protein tyrosine kinase EpsG
MLISAYQPFGPAAEAFRMLRSQLMLRWFDKGRKVIAVGAPRTGTGCSTLTANLAVSFAQLGERTLLLDANFRNPAQHQLFGMSAETGLADVLLGRSSVERSIVSIAQLNGLAVLCAGPIPPNPHELLSSRAMQYLLELASEIYDVVIVDAPPILEYADAQMIASRAGGYVLVTRRHRTRMNDVSAVQERLAPSGATLLGAIVNE